MGSTINHVLLELKTKLLSTPHPWKCGAVVGSDLQSLQLLFLSLRPCYTARVCLQLLCACTSPGDLIKIQILIQQVGPEILRFNRLLDVAKDAGSMDQIRLWQVDRPSTEKVSPFPWLFAKLAFTCSRFLGCSQQDWGPWCTESTNDLLGLVWEFWLFISEWNDLCLEPADKCDSWLCNHVGHFNIIKTNSEHRAYQST